MKFAGQLTLIVACGHVVDVLNVNTQVDANKESIIQISLEATQEAALEASLAQVTSKVFALEIPITPYKDYKDAYTLGNLEHMTTILDDSIMTVATILASRRALPDVLLVSCVNPGPESIVPVRASR